MAIIDQIFAHPILDSNSNWTIFTTVVLDNGIYGSSSVPSGHSLGPYDAVVLPTQQAVELVNNVLGKALKGMDVSDQWGIDKRLIEMDGTENKSKLGANTILSISQACFIATANFLRKQPYQHIQEYYGFPQMLTSSFPIPLINLINGGEHATNSIEFQSFMIAPASFIRYPDGLRMAVNIYQTLKGILAQNNLSTSVGEEGGYSPHGIDVETVCHYIIEAIIQAGYKAGNEVFLAIDVAANSFFSEPNYQTRGVLGSVDADTMIETYAKLTRNYPILYLEDPLATSHPEHWNKLNQSLRNKIEIIGDDLTATNKNRLIESVNKHSVTGINIKPNQVGSLSETIEVIKMAKTNRISVVISHRAGDTGEDTFIADLAVGTGSEYVKSGATARGERTVKYNRLLHIYANLPDMVSSDMNTTEVKPQPPRPGGEVLNAVDNNKLNFLGMSGLPLSSDNNMVE